MDANMIRNLLKPIKRVLETKQQTEAKKSWIDHGDKNFSQRRSR